MLHTCLSQSPRPLSSSQRLKNNSLETWVTGNMAKILNSPPSAVAVLMVHLVAAISGPSSVQLQNNEYKNVLVAISPDVPEDPALIQSIKNAFIGASSYLYLATNQRAVFRDVIILVPSTWRVQASYGASTWQVLGSADVVVTGSLAPAAPSPPLGGAPGESSVASQAAAAATFTKSYAGCGQHGIRISISTDVLTNSQLASTLGSPARVLVHEWATFRWGVFNEYGQKGSYSSTTRHPRGNWREFGAQKGLPDSFTKWTRRQANLQPETMHNYNAPSRHNRLCGHRSTWSVIAGSEDFKNGRNPPREGVDTMPVFTIVQAPGTPRLVLALDTSSSMSEDNKLLLMRQAVASFISDGLPPETVVGMITFNENADVQRPPVTLRTPEDRQKFVDHLPTDCGGATSIASALVRAAELLHNTAPTTSIRNVSSSELPALSSMGHVLVITDGEQTTGPDVSSVKGRLETAGLAVSFVLLGGQPPDDLLALARDTGGRSYYDLNGPESTAAVDALFDFLDIFNTGAFPSPVQLCSRAREVSSEKGLEGEVAIDADVGQTTVFIFSYSESAPEVSVRSPSGRFYDRRYPEYLLDARLQLIKIQVPLKAETGRWKYKAINTGIRQRISLLVLSSPANASDVPVQLTGSLINKPNVWPTTMHIIGEATQRGRPVLGLTMYATVFGPFGDPISTQLMDNGAGSDIVEDDGVYSRYFSKFTGPGLYTVRLTATGFCPEGENSSQCTPDPQYGNVERTASAGYIFITMNTSAHQSSSGSDDTEAPVRISDLRVVKTSSKNRTVVLSWRASGDDTDQETASEYEVLFAPTIADLLTLSSRVLAVTKAEVVHGNLKAPQSFGNREYLSVRIPASLDQRQPRLHCRRHRRSRK
ncbi:calcium-activated chloride channel regulator 1-like [Pomacea canaliculata]|uniref:calcium-activated chloride channel regulator 1-like n=1 Tax=Pomacea canaliculata TaxID=400727 RepID=UPI000D734751|nr:calcium-activated chloride channel regulator 1-like [Pomacea canaliculata]